MSQPSIWKAVAARMGEWHGTLPTSTTPPPSPASSSSASSSEPDVTLWNVLQKWISALPDASKSQKERKELLQKELDLLQLGEDEGGFNIKGQDGGMGVVVGHCDLLNGNVIILPEDDGVTSAGGNTKVHFIDYE
jgi:ethanolamine kinase